MADLLRTGVCIGTTGTGRNVGSLVWRPSRAGGPTVGADPAGETATEHVTGQIEQDVNHGLPPNW